jgi:hypothetical protein
MQRVTCELERIREGSAEPADARSDLSLAYELYQENTFKVIFFLIYTILSETDYVRVYLYYNFRCMLNARGEKMRACLINIFKIILKFHNRLRSQAWTIGDAGQYTHTNFKSLEQMYQSFCEWRTYMTHVAHKLATSGYQPHLTHFLNALNINDMYDLTAKPVIETQ